MRKFLIALLIIISLPLFASAYAEEYDYKVVDGKMHIFGYILEPRYPIKYSSPEEDDDTVISINPSISGRWIIICTGYMEKTEMWLFDTRKKTRPAKIDFQPRGRHISKKWHNDEIFEIRHTGMGYWTSDFYRAQDLTKTFQVDSIMLYDLARDIYVSFYMDGIEIGKGFNRDNLKPERFNIDLEYEYVSDAISTIEDVTIQDPKLIVIHRKLDGTLASETFIPAHLNEDTLNAEKSDESAPTPEPLPEIFSPLSWEMNIRELKNLFPSAEIQETAWTSPKDEKMISSMVLGIKWDHFGEAHIDVSHHKYKHIDIINISTTETRPECFEGKPAWCRTSYNDELVKILGELKGLITKAYGPPLEYKGGYREAAGLPPDPREGGYKWERDGYNLFLSITVGEEEDWAVGLQAVRREWPH
jgi:hypothetical protein